MDLLDCNMLDLIKGPACSIDVCLSLIHQLLAALEHVHSLGLIHRDIKPENCLIDKQTMKLKLADFGSARMPSSHSQLTEYVATRWYRPPEVLIGMSGYGAPIDVWAVGCVAYELITKVPLFPGRDQYDQMQRIRELITPGNSGDPRTLFPEFRPDVADLLAKLLAFNPEDRITAKMAMSHPAFGCMASLPPVATKSAPRTPIDRAVRPKLFVPRHPIAIAKVRVPSRYLPMDRGRMRNGTEKRLPALRAY
jgi:serine/threonine protein kinase